MRVLHVFPDLRLGGADRCVLDLIRGSEARGVQTKLCILGTSPTFPCRSLLPSDWVHLNHPGGFKSPYRVGRLVRALRQTVGDYSPDLVHSHLWPADVAVALALRSGKIPMVSHQQGTNPSLLRLSPRSQTKRLITRELFKKSRTRFICVSNSVEAYVHRLLGQTSIDSRVIYNSVDLERFAPSGYRYNNQNDNVIIGSAARLVPEKGLDVLLKAYAEAHKTLGERAELQIAGSGGELDNLRVIARSLGIEESVKFLGAVDEMSDFYRGLSVFVLPSLQSEGFPLAIVEAMASGLPVIATDVGGSHEAFKTTFSGIVVPPNNVDLLAQAIRSVAESPDLANAMSPTARKCAERFFALDTMVSRSIEYYKDILTDRASSA